MSRLTLERYQVWAYLIAIGLGLAVGTAWPGIGPAMETLLWPTLAALLFATFLQVPLLHVRDALRDRWLNRQYPIFTFYAVVADIYHT